MLPIIDDEEVDLLVRKFATKAWLRRLGKPAPTSGQVREMLEQLTIRSRRCFSRSGKFLPKKHAHISWGTLARLTGFRIHDLRKTFFRQDGYFIIVGTRSNQLIDPEAIALVGRYPDDQKMMEFAHTPEFYKQAHLLRTI
jgi:hypothetical protein